MLLSKITGKIHFIAREIEKPILHKLRKEGGLPTFYEQLNTPWFRSLGIDTVLDIGANTGQFTRTISTLLPSANIYSFEPIPDCFEKLQEFANNHNNIKIFNTGIGDKSGVISFEQNEYSPSSSFLKMSDIHKKAFTFTENSNTVDVKIEKLDDIAQSLDLGKSLFIKIDVQGYEDKVLQGGSETIKKAKIVIVETSFVPLYESQPLFDDIYSVFKEWGFLYLGMNDQLADPNTGRMLQGDAVFTKC
jgi:FkbM family methyltransferase